MRRNATIKLNYDDTINSAIAAEQVEHFLTLNPNEQVQRSRLIHYYFHGEIRADLKVISDGRLRHIKWFIQNEPQSKFCGTNFFSIQLDDPHYAEVITLWETAAAAENNEHAKVNACMFVAKTNPTAGLDLLNKFFSAKQNIWAECLKDLLSSSKTCFDSLIAEEALANTHISTSAKARAVDEWRKKKDWVSIAMKDFEKVPPQLAAVRASHPNLSLIQVSKLAGCSFSKFEMSSILGFDPEVLVLRFAIACWITRHLAHTSLMTNPVFMAPFDTPKTYFDIEQKTHNLLSKLFGFIAELLINELKASPSNQALSNNAAYLALEWQHSFQGSQNIITELNSSKVGRDALKGFSK